MSEPSDWSTRLAEAITAKFNRANARWIRLHSVTPVAPEVVEVLYSDVADPNPTRGLRIDAPSFRSGPELLKDSTIGELALYVVEIALLEPKPTDEFLPPDDNGIRWLPMQQWLDGLYTDSEQGPRS